MSQVNSTPRGDEGQISERGDALLSFPGFRARCHPLVLALIVIAVIVLAALAYFGVVAVIDWASPAELTRLITAIWPDGASIP